MIAFVAVATVMVAGALLAILPPLLARRESEISDRGSANIALLRRALEDNDAELRAGAIDKAQWEQTKREIERRALEESQAADGGKPVTVVSERSPRIAVALGILLPIAAVSLYVVLGEPRAITAKVPTAEEASAHTLQSDQIEAMIGRLSERLKAAPDDAEGWLTLGRTLAFVGRLPDALNAYERAVKLMPNDARLLADYADIYGATTGGGSLMGEPEKIIKRALEIDPKQPKALALAGTIAFQKKDFAAAAAHWERALAVLPPDGEFAKQIAAGINEAREAMGQKGLPVAATAQEKAAKSAPPPAKGSPKASSGGALSGTVTLAPALAKKAGPDDTVFIFARLPEGGAPLAVIRIKARELPYNFKLDDAMSMSADNKLSNASRVIITARVTKTGNVVPQPGDLEGASAPVAPGVSGLSVRIDKER